MIRRIAPGLTHLAIRAVNEHQSVADMLGTAAGLWSGEMTPENKDQQWLSNLHKLIFGLPPAYTGGWCGTGYIMYHQFTQQLSEFTAKETGSKLIMLPVPPGYSKTYQWEQYQAKLHREVWSEWFDRVAGGEAGWDVANKALPRQGSRKGKVRPPSSRCASILDT